MTDALNRLFAGENVLVLGAHPDDELACGATVAKLAQSGDINIYFHFFCPCQLSLRDIGLPEDQLLTEADKSRETLGIDLSRCGHSDLPVRELAAHRQEVLEILVKMRKEISPALVFIPTRSDIHQDHTTVCEEAVRAFKNTTVLGYEMPWNTLQMNNDCLVPITEELLNIKIKAAACYKSQQHRNYADAEYYRSLARVRGVQANTKYAECFEVIRLYL